MTPTPETLRAEAERIAANEQSVVQPNRHMLALADRLDAAADAWEKGLRDMMFIVDGQAEELIALRKRLEEAEKPCIWKTQSDGNGDYWDTACGHAICFEVDGPIENEYEYCPGCGHPLMLVPRIDEVDVDDCPTLAPDDSGRKT